MLTKFLVALLVFLLVAIGGLYFGQRFFFYPAPQQLLASPPPGFSFVETSTSDGLKLRAAYRPANDGKPTLVFFHGNGDSIGGAHVATKLLTDAGYGALLVEYRGYGGNAGSASEEGFYRDGEAAMAWLNAQNIAPARTVIIGNSIGSGPATEMAVRHNPAALVLVSGLASLPFVVSDLYSFVPANLLVRDRYDNVAKLGQVKSPILLLHGDADTLVRATNAQRLAKAAPSAKLVIVPLAGHDLAYSEAGQQPVIDWLGVSLLRDKGVL